LACVALVDAGNQPASAQEAITVIADAPRNESPNGVTFTLSFNAPAGIEEVRLRYQLAPDGTGAAAIAQCSTAATTNCSFTLTSGRGIFVIPGAEITYHWEIEDADGNRLETEERLYIHEDTRFEFRTISDANVTVYYHDGTAEEAPAVLAAAVEALADVGALEQVTVDFPVKVFLYATAAEMQPAIVSSADDSLRILGEVVYSDTAMVSADSGVLDITRHEIAHIVTRVATKGAFGIESWLDEGIAVYAEGEQLGGFEVALDAAINGDRVLRMSQLNAGSTGRTGGTAGLFYGQAGSIVRFLVETFGADKFAELLRVFKDGSTSDDAYMQVYGFDELGLENAWRESVGLDPVTAQPTPTPRPTEEARANPTPSSGDSGGSAAGGDDEDDGAPVVLGSVIAALAVAIAASGAVAWRTVRSRL
jgi:hypothetical protein